MTRPGRTIKQLEVLISTEHAGTVRLDPEGRLSFAYTASWNSAHPAFPLSYALPQNSARHGHKEINAYLWGLLPENPAILDRLALDNQIAARNPLALLAVVGRDCPGAVQFLTKRDIQNDAEASNSDIVDVRWLPDQAICEILKGLRTSRGATGRGPDDPGQFSLAGAQPKTALFRDGGRWGIPVGRTPTTHILKPPMLSLDGQVENEHFCLSLARQLGLLAASSEVVTFGSEVAIAVERFDRIKANGAFYRIHQEDMCQALGVMPESKYQKNGGPGGAAIMERVLRASSAPDSDRRRFMQAWLFNFVIAGTDAHGKNYSVLHDDAAMRLAPLYDINSLLPYELDLRKVRMSMSVDRHYTLLDIMPRHWSAQAVDCGVSADRTLADLQTLIGTIPDAASTVADACRRKGLTHPIVDKLQNALVERCRQLAKVFGTS